MLETSQAFVDSLLPVRDREAHKGCFGKVLLLCGSVGYTGAAAMAAEAALRCGSGLIFLGVPQTVYPILAAKLNEPMVFSAACRRVRPAVCTGASGDPLAAEGL